MAWPLVKRPAIASTSRPRAGQPVPILASGQRLEHLVGFTLGQDHLGRGLLAIEVDAELAGGDLQRADLAVAPELHGNSLWAGLGGDDLEVGVRLQDRSVVFQQDVALLHACQIGRAVGLHHKDRDAVIGGLRRCRLRLRLGIGGVAQGQQAGRAGVAGMGPDQPGEHGPRGSITDDQLREPGWSGRDQRLDRQASQVLGREDDEFFHILEMRRQRLQPLPRDLRGEAVPGREVLVRQGLAERLDRPIILLGPVATLARAGDLDPGRIAVFPHDAGPVVRRSRSFGPEIDPADQGCIRGERGLDLLQRGRLAGEGPVPGLQRLLEFQESSPQAALLIPELFEPSVVVLGSSRIGGELADLLVEPLQLPQEIGHLAPLFRGQGAELTGREIVEQAPCEARFPGSPGIPVLMLTGRSEGEGGQRVDSRRLGSLESRTAQSPSTLLEAFGSGFPMSDGLLEPALSIQVGRQVVVALGGVGVALAQRLAADVQGPLVEGLGVAVPALRVQVARQVVVAGGGVGVALAQRLAADVQGPLVEGLGVAVPALRVQVARQVVVAGGGAGVALAQRLAADVQGPLEQGLGLAVPTLRVQVQRQVVVASGGVGVALAQHLANDVQGPLVEGLGVGVPALRFQVVCQAVVDGGRVGVALAQHLANDVQGPLEQGLGLAVPALRVQVARQVVVAGGGAGVALAQHLAADVQGPLVEGLGLAVPALRVQVARQVVVASGGVGVALAQHLAADVQGPLVEGLGLAVPALRVQVARQVVVASGGVGVALAQRLAAMSRALWNRGWASPYRPCAFRLSARLL